ncbi:unnamed protein product [Caenorhabditis angaria]|uniref:Sdz-33 F-box domain-containing protein n=1 Tax=Caenorhabditis angaria TaxID=860376 RepID=A0A9P1N710_9PELO|nr:unnamed protein product [Caenorhabditis angaria]
MELPPEKLQSQEEAEKSIFDVLPQEIRRIIIEEMDFWTFLNFSKSSQKCRDEAKMFGNVIKSMRIYDGRTKHDFFIEFCFKNGVKMMIRFVKGDLHRRVYEKNSKLDSLASFSVYSYKNYADNKTWLEIGENDDGLKVMAVRLINLILKSCATNSPIEIFCGIPDFRYDLINIKHLNNIKNLEMLFSKEFDYDFIPKKQLFKIKSSINIGFNEIRQLKSNFVHLPETKMSIQEINQFLKLWKNGKLPKNLKFWTFGILEGEDEVLDHEGIKKGLKVTKFRIWDNGFLDMYFESSINSNMETRVIYTKTTVSICFDIPK